MLLNLKKNLQTYVPFLSGLKDDILFYDYR